MEETMYEYTLPFIREESGRTTTISIVKLVTRKPCKTVEEQTKALIKAVSYWVTNSKDGKECWNYSAEDLNIGDLASYEKSFRRSIKKKEWGGLVLADIEFLWGGEASSGTMYYDRHLVE